MAEYIERGRLKEAISADCQHLFSFDTSFYDMVMIDIDEVPAEDVAPVVHGRWILRKEPDGRLCFGCSNCGKSENKHAAIKGKYCWSCGAKMDLEE